MFCQQCGTKLGEAATFCSNCGARTSSDGSANSSPGDSSPAPNQAKNKTGSTIVALIAGSLVAYGGWQIYEGAGGVPAISGSSLKTAITGSLVEAGVRAQSEDSLKERFKLAPKPFCADQLNKVVTVVDRGTMSRPDSGFNGRTLPAYVIKTDFLCLNQVSGTKDPWTFYFAAAVDDEFKVSRCVVEQLDNKALGAEALLADKLSGCNFVSAMAPSQGSVATSAHTEPRTEEAPAKIVGVYTASKLGGQVPTGLPQFDDEESYSTVRVKMVQAGWAPFHSKDADTCADGDLRCKGRPEMQACAGTGLANCKFLWQRDGKTVAILTVGEEDAVYSGLGSYP
jgi:hypothetical protein